MTKVLYTTLVFLALVATATAQPDDPGDICALMSGQEVPSGLRALDTEGVGFDVSQALGEQPTILLFFRGGW